MTPFLPTVEEFKLQVVEAWSISQVDYYDSSALSFSFGHTCALSQ